MLNPKVHAIIEDTRQQDGKHDHVNAWFKAAGIRVVRTKMLVGDYTLPTDQSVCVDTKYGLSEVYGNLVVSHDRFRAECVLAQELGIKLIVLVEEDGICELTDVDKWVNPRAESYEFLRRAQEHGMLTERKLSSKPPISSDRLRRMMQTMTERYGVEWRFCSKARTAETIVELLGGGDDGKEKSATG